MNDSDFPTFKAWFKNDPEVLDKVKDYSPDGIVRVTATFYDYYYKLLQDVVREAHNKHGLSVMQLSIDTGLPLEFVNKMIDNN